jgi:hypothetical protein
VSQLAQQFEVSGEEMLLISAARGWGLDELFQRIAESLYEKHFYV